MSGIFDQVINYAPPSLLKGTVTYKGTWSAATNTPTLINPPDSTTNGFYYVVNAAGTQFSLSFNIGDWIISNGSAWEKVDNTDAVSSVFGRTGAVVGVSTDYSSVGITATAVGASSPSTGAFTTLSATTPLAVASGGTGVASSTGTTNVVLSGSPTITTPVIAQINDANGNETLKLASIASAVNEVTIENAATGNAVHISATGGDASVGLHLAGKGASGYVNVQDSVDATKRIMFNASGGTTNTRTMLSSTQTVDRTLSLPDATDTLVGKATTDTLTNKTLTSPTITGGALNGTLGATTPSTIAATTISASGAINSTANGQAMAFQPTTATAAGYVAFLNTGGFSYIGIDSSTGSSFGRGNYNFNIYAALDTVISRAGSEVGRFTSTGLNSTAIGATTPSTGAFTTLGATGQVNITGGTLSQLQSQAGSVYFEQINTNTGAGAGVQIFQYNSGAGAGGDASIRQFTGAQNWIFGIDNSDGDKWKVSASDTLGTSDVLAVSTTGLAVTGTGSFSGNVGIGGASVSNALDVNGDIRVQGGNRAIKFNNASVEFSLAQASGATAALTLAANLAITGALSTTGNITMTGASSPEISFNRAGSPVSIGSDAAGEIFFYSSGTKATITTAGLAVTGALSCTGGANFGALDSTPIGGYTRSSGAFTGITMGSGTGTVSATAGVFSVTSDLRAKNPIGKFTKGLTEIVALADHSEIYSFKSDDKNTPRAGWYAQDVEPLIPEAVFHDGADGMASLDERPIVVALVNAVKELSARLAALESK